MWIIFIGPPGAGKGTQSQQLIAYLGIPHLSTGEMLRQALADGNPVGRDADEYMSKGQLVPDPVIIKLVDARLKHEDCCHGGLFDGFPRTIGQAEALDETLARRGTPLDMVLELRVSDEQVLRRLHGRRRKDDLPNIVVERLKTFRKLTQPLLSYYSKRGLLEVIDGTGTPDEVFERIRTAVDSRRVAGERGERTGG